jgi:hypothetical protein
MGWMVNATPQLLYPLEKRPGTHCVEGSVGIRAGLHGFGKSCPHWNSALHVFELTYEVEDLHSAAGDARLLGCDAVQLGEYLLMF